MNVLQQHDQKRNKFIVRIQPKESQPCVLITKQPIFTKDQTSYFLLICKSKKQKLIQLCYILGQAIYLDSNKFQVQSFVQNIIGINTHWKHRNIIILVKNQERRAGIISIERDRQLGASTSADTRSLIDRDKQKSLKSSPQQGILVNSRVNSVKQNSIVQTYKYKLIPKINQDLKQYFTEINFSTKEVLYNNQSIADNFQSFQFNLGSFYFTDFIPEIIKMINQISNNKYNKNFSQAKNIQILEIINFNIKLSLDELAKNVFQSYQEIIKMQFIQSQTLDLQKSRYILKNLAESTIDSFSMQAGKFIEQPSYIIVYQQLQNKIKKQQQKIFELIEKFNNEHSMRKFKQYQQEQFIDFDTLIGLQNNLLKTLFADFESYSDVLLKKVCVVFEQFFNKTDTKIKKKKKQINYVVSNKDKLQNLQERIVIYKQKKNALSNEVKLGQRQEQKLIQVIRGLQVENNLKKPDQFEVAEQRFSQNRYSSIRDKKPRMNKMTSQY